MEVGLGGLLDTTNIITPMVSVLTSIGMDHMDILGPTIEHIAREKAGIIKQGIPVILGPTAQHKVITDTANSLNSQIISIDPTKQ